MSKKCHYKITLSLTLALNFFCYSRLPDFGPLMHLGNFKSLSEASTQQLLGISGVSVLNHFIQLYGKNTFKLDLKRSRIPKIIHQIWLGSPFPERYKAWQRQLQNLHPEWEYKLWTDEDVKFLRLRNKDLYDQAKNFGQKADILRYEILYQFGGLYLDVDIQCLKSFNNLHNNFDFYAALEPLWENNLTCLSVGNCVIGSVKGHPILEYCLENLRSSFFQAYKDLLLYVVITTGPVFFTKACYHRAGRTSYKDIILPSAFFFPNTKSIEHSFAYCIHYWTHSWLK